MEKRNTNVYVMCIRKVYNGLLKFSRVYPIFTFFFYFFSENFLSYLEVVHAHIYSRPEFYDEFLVFVDLQKSRKIL